MKNQKQNQNQNQKQNQKHYRCRDIDMLITSLVICEHFEEHKQELINLQANWKDPFIAKFKERINNALDNYIGKSTYHDLKIATHEINKLLEKAYNKLSLFKVQIEMAYKDDPSHTGWLLSTFGYDEYWKKVQNKAQEPTIAILYRIKQNLTPDITTNLTQKGIELKLPTEIADMAEPLEKAEVKQETLKTKVNQTHATTREEFNTIYQTTIAICTLGNKHFKKDPIIKTKFSFKKRLKSLHNKPKP